MVDVRFWLVDWVGMGPLCGLSRQPFKLAVNNDSFVRDCFEVTGGSWVWVSLLK